MKKKNKNNDSKSLDDYFVSENKKLLQFIVCYSSFLNDFCLFFFEKFQNSWKMMNKYMSYEIDLKNNW